MLRRVALCLLSLGCLPFSGCAAFVLPRPAHIEPGTSVSGSLVVTSPPGDAASWYWSFMCASDCDHVMVAPSLTISTALPAGTAPRVELAGGVAGMDVFTEGYIRLDSGTGARAWGIGGRFGVIPPHLGAVYARLNLRRTDERTLFINPTYAFHHYRGSFHALLLPIATHETDGRSGMTLALSPAISYTRRETALSSDEHSAWSAFVVLSASWSLHFDRP